MSILQTNVNIVYKVHSLSLNGDGSCDIKLARITQDAVGRTNILGFKKVHILEDAVNVALESTPIGNTNRKVIANMVYTYLVTNNIITGTIT
jgi:hypothetical protein